MRQLARPKVNKETGEGGPGNGELCNCPVDASDPKHPRNEEERCQKLLNKLKASHPHQVRTWLSTAAT
jgi:hypothetical protein